MTRTGTVGPDERASTTTGTGGADDRASTTTGTTGSAWRASITPWGAVVPWDATPRIDWYVAADDRWHVPAEEPTVRQVRLDGTPVTETRVRVPGGDVVQRIASVPDDGGVTVIEVENESTMPVAIAFDRRGVLTERPLADIPIEGIDLPAGSFVMPLGHRASLRIGIAHGRARSGALPSNLPTARQVANGWLATTERASRFVVPDGADGRSLAERITGLRCEIALGQIPAAGDDAPGFAIALGELVRMGDAPDPWLAELVEAVEAIAPSTRWVDDVALRSAQRVLVAAGEQRARRDLDRIVRGRPVSPRPDTAPDGLASMPWLESLFAFGTALFPAGLPPAWLGQPFEVHDVPTSPGSTVSYAIRWHGERPAILWEQFGDVETLTAPVAAPGWTTGEQRGEALWPPPDAASRPPSPATKPAVLPHDGGSFA